MSHLAVERNRRKQMNKHLQILRSLTPCFYIKKSDQASIIGGAIDFIKELHQILQSLESKKQRKSVSPSPRSHFRPLLQATPSPLPLVRQLDPTFGTSCNSPLADVEAKISGSNVMLKVVSKRIPGQLVKIITLLEKLSFQVLHLNISSLEETVLLCFVIKIGLECELSLEELTLEVQQSFFCKD